MNKTKKMLSLLRVSLLVIIGLLLLTEPTQSMSPKTMKVLVSPNQRVYTVSLNLEYDPDELQIKDVDFGEQLKPWLPLPVPEYDYIDNQAGEMVKTAGYPRGFNHEELFITIYYKGDISSLKVGDDSLILNKHSKNVFNKKFITLK